MLTFDQFIAEHSELQDLSPELQNIAYDMYLQVQEHMWIAD